MFLMKKNFYMKLYDTNSNIDPILTDNFLELNTLIKLEENEKNN